MSTFDAIDKACAAVGIVAPSSPPMGRWIKTDIVGTRNGKGDGRVIVNDRSVTAWNWQTGEKETAWVDSDRPVDRAKIATRIKVDKADKARRAREAVDVADRLMRAARVGPHPYLARKGFGAEKALVIDAQDVVALGAAPGAVGVSGRALTGAYLVPPGANRAILIPASLRGRICSLQLIWEDGTKKFLAGGEMGGATYQMSRGRETWLCEGFATGLSLRTVLRSLNRSDAVVCCFSASNLATVAPRIEGRCWIAADCDKPMPQFDGLGTGEHYARVAGKPYMLPDAIGDDFNDMHQRDGIFAVQKRVSALIRGVQAKSKLEAA